MCRVPKTVKYRPIVPFCFRSKVIGSGVRRSNFFFCMGFSMGFFGGPKKRYFFKKVAGRIFDVFFSVYCGISEMLMIFDFLDIMVGISYMIVLSLGAPPSMANMKCDLTGVGCSVRV